MMKLSLNPQKKAAICAVMKERRTKFGGSDAQFAKSLDINASIYSRLMHGETHQVMSDAKWLSVARKLNMETGDRKWRTMRTEVLEFIEDEVRFCQEYAKSRILIDDCEIGKSHAAKYLAGHLDNCYYIDSSQCKGKQAFIRSLARTLGTEDTGRLQDVKDDLKYYIKTLYAAGFKPIIIVDEFGDLLVSYDTVLELKELWNATENICGWYMIGAEGAKAKLLDGIKNNRIGFRELFSRWSSNFSRIVPTDKDERRAFYKELVTTVLDGNAEDKNIIPQVVKKCMSKGGGGLRRAESLLIIETSELSESETSPVESELEPAEIDN